MTAMILRASIRIFILLFIVTGLTTWSLSCQAMATESETLFLTLLNQEREEALTLESSFQTAAELHCSEMVENTYFSKISLDGTTFYDRLARAGAVSRYKNEKIGMIFFKGFINENKAAKILYQNMIRDEQDETAGRVMLSRDYQYAGISIQSAHWKTATDEYNVYICVLSLGSYATTSQAQLLNLINQARAYPDLVAGGMGIVLMEALSPAPPVTLDIRLSTAVAGHTEDMISTGYLSEISPEGWLPYDRAAAQGYVADYIDEKIELSFFCGDILSPEDMINLLFKRILSLEVEGSTAPGGFVFNPTYQDAGIAVVIGESDEFTSLCGNKVMLAAVDMGHEFGSNTLFEGRLSGVVFDDGNENGLYDAGEGLEGRVVKIYSDDWRILFSTVTDGGGGWQVGEVSEKQVLIEVEFDGETVTLTPFDKSFEHQFVTLKKPIKDLTIQVDTY